MKHLIIILLSLTLSGSASLMANSIASSGNAISSIVDKDKEGKKKKKKACCAKGNEKSCSKEKKECDHKNEAKGVEHNHENSSKEAEQK